MKTPLLSLGVFSLTALASLASAQANDLDDPFAALEPMADEELKEERGGFTYSGITYSGGYEVHYDFGVELRVIVDNARLAGNLAQDAATLGRRFTVEDGMGILVLDQITSPTIEINNTVDDARFVQDILLNFAIPDFDQTHEMNSASFAVSDAMASSLFLSPFQ